MAQVKKFEEYQLKEKLYTDPMGKVYKALHKTFGKVELRTLPGNLDKDLAYKSSFLANTKKAINLNHPNIIKIYQSGEFQGRLFISNEFSKGGGSLSMLLSRQNKMPLKNSYRIILGITEALIELENKGLLHKDIRPENIYITSDGNAKLKNVGLIGNLKYNNADHILGNINYISPELIESHTKADLRSDIYSLGICFYHMITGIIPFFDASDEAIVIKIKKGNLPNASTINSAVPHSISWVLDRMCQKKPKERFQTAQELLEVLSQMESQVLGEAKNETFSMPEVPDSIPDAPMVQGGNFPDTPPAFPDTPPAFPDTPPAFPDTPPAFPDTPPAFPDTPSVYPDTTPVYDKSPVYTKKNSYTPVEEESSNCQEYDNSSNSYEDPILDNFESVKTKPKKEEAKAKKPEKDKIIIKKERANLTPLYLLLIIGIIIGGFFFLSSKKEEAAKRKREEKKEQAKMERQEREREKRIKIFGIIKGEVKKALNNYGSIDSLKTCRKKVENFCEKYSKHEESNELKRFLPEFKIRIKLMENQNKYSKIESKIVVLIKKKDFDKAEKISKISIEQPEYKEIKDKLQNLYIRVKKQIDRDFQDAVKQAEQLTKEVKYTEAIDLLRNVSKYQIDEYQKQLKDIIVDVKNKESKYKKINFLIKIEKELYELIVEKAYDKCNNFIKKKYTYKKEKDFLFKYIKDLNKMNTIFYSILKRDIRRKKFKFYFKTHKPFTGSLIVFSEKTGNLLININYRSTNFNIRDLTWKCKKTILSKRIPLNKKKTHSIFAFYLLANDEIEFAEKELKPLSKKEKLWHQEKIARIIIDKLKREKDKETIKNLVEKLSTDYKHTDSFKFKKYDLAKLTFEKFKKYRSNIFMELISKYFKETPFYKKQCKGQVVKQQKYKELIEQMIDKIDELEKEYPDIVKSLDILTESLKQRMLEIKEKISSFDKQDKNMCTLLILNRIHRSIEKYLER